MARRPIRSRCRCTAATATRASTRSSSSCATTGSTRFTKAPTGSRRWTCWAASWRRPTAPAFDSHTENSMDFEYSHKTRDLIARVGAFMDEHVYPNEARHAKEVAEGSRWAALPLMEELKAKAKAQGLWNLFLPESESG